MGNENLRAKKENTALRYVLLYCALLLFSSCSVFSKISAAYPLPSLGFLLFYGLSLGMLGIYAIVWQIVLKHFDLTVAYANRASVTLMGMLWGVLIFHEEISWNMVLGAVIIVVGILVVVVPHGN